MDTSKERIEMCRKAVEIQELWKASVGDMTNKGCVIGISIPHLLVAVRVPEKPLEQEFLLKKELIWLPLQGQLQDMIFDEADNLRCQCGMIYDFVDSELGTHYNTYGTMEQLWLAFVMHEKYGKKWNGEDWE